MIRRVLNKVSREAGQFFYKRVLPIGGTSPIVSFTFDDFPVSAGTTASELLAKYGFQGTYYLAGNLMGKDWEDLPMCDKELVLKLYNTGNEIGCHTYMHCNCQETAFADLQEDLAKNADLIKSIIGDAPSSFAYPFGISSLSARKAVAEQFNVARGIKAGINKGTTDFRNLKANSLYSNSINFEGISRLLDEAKESGGWLIFYTHDVTDTPSPFGCTPGEFDKVLGLVSERDIQVMPVKHAAGHFAFS